MNLVIDIGNTVAKLAFFEDGVLQDVVCTSNDTLADLDLCLEKYKIEKGIVSTVIDLTDEVKSRLMNSEVRFVMMNSRLKLPVGNLYSTPETLGSDRIAAVVGANMQYPDRNILVIDAGTCITYDFIDSENNYHGGNISPGVRMRLKALNDYTSRLPLIDPEGPCPSLGHNTETAIRAGVVRGVQLEVQGYVDMMSKKYPGLFVFLTGGDAFSFDINSKNRIFADKFLVLRGLNRLLEYNEIV